MRSLLLLACCALAAAAGAATPIPPGKWSFVFEDAKGPAGRPMRVYTYRPRDCDAKCPIVLALPGEARDASAFRDHWELPADGYRVLVVAPELAARDWPGPAEYALGGVGEHRDPARWAFSALEHLFEEVRDGQNGYVIHGHGAGGQLVQRMALLAQGSRATAFVASAPGWYTLPEWRKDRARHAFPHSLVDAPAGEAEVRQALARRFLLLVGDRDAEGGDPLAKSAGARAQGESPVERAETLFKAATARSQELGVPLAWELHELPGTAHDAAAASRAAARILYGSR